MKCIICSLPIASEIDFAGEIMKLCNSWQCWYCHFKQSQSYLLQAYVRKFQFLTYKSESSIISSTTISLPTKKIASYVPPLPETTYKNSHPLNSSENQVSFHTNPKGSTFNSTRYPSDTSTSKSLQHNEKFSLFIPTQIPCPSNSSVSLPATYINTVRRKRGRPRKYPVEISPPSLKTPKSRELARIPIPSSLEQKAVNTLKQSIDEFKLYVDLPYSSIDVEKLLRIYLTHISPRLSSKYIIFLLNLLNSDLDYSTAEALNIHKQSFDIFFQTFSKSERKKPKQRITMWLKQNAAIIKRLKSELIPQEWSSLRCTPSSYSTESMLKNNSNPKLPEDDIMVVPFEGENYLYCKTESNSMIYDLEESSV